MKKIAIIVVIFFFISGIGPNVSAQKADSDKDSLFVSSVFSGLSFRNIGPAFMSGRIADIAIHPIDENIWYIAVGSGGVWKTTNAGVTWSSLFDKQTSYSIGCLTIDPTNPHIVWVGTGENIGGRHVGFGDGVYRSEDGGTTWQNMGLKKSEHISKIIVHPSNSNIIWVAAQGPLWTKGGERGLYKSIDGGKSWQKTLGDDKWVGVTDIAIDPRNPDILYAATWQRQRNIASYMGGGPGSGIYRSYDGGLSWEKLIKGLPTSNMGKIGLAISPIKPDILYAAIELDRRTGGVFKSTDRGASWLKQSETVSSATGPHYYQELYASPHYFDRLYLMDVRTQISLDGGKTFKRLNEQNKHGDNHAICFKKSDPDYLMMGTDGGLYESFDDAENWRFMANLPLTQFYKVAVDDALPFYNVYGGTQDNSTQCGPSRTDSRQGIRNADWYVVMGGDGHQPATEPGNPDIVYAESQEGELHRIDVTTGEKVYIKPQPLAGEDYERNNWDSPILVSPHSPTRIFFTSQRLWRSDDRGDSWTAISGDLTRNQDRMKIPLMEQTWSWDANWDYEAMSNYNTITSIAESPVKEGLIYIGTDDGLIQYTENGGESWNKIEVAWLPGVPASAFVNDIKADLFDENTVYVALDNHKFGDYKPYLLKSTDRAKTWKSIASNIPDRNLVWRMVQDYVNPDLLFTATEFGIYFSVNGGGEWIQFKAGLPAIPFRDLVIQKRENDLVAASFGRGFFILDDYSALRDITPEMMKEEAKLFPVKDALLFIERQKLGYNEKGTLGADYFTAPNPPFGAIFTYYLKDTYKTKQQLRQENEKKLIGEGKQVAFEGWDEVEVERRQDAPVILLVVKDEQGNIIRKIQSPAAKGIQRVAWDLRTTSVNAIDVNRASPDRIQAGYMVQPGKYSVILFKQIDGVVTQLSGPVEFKVTQLYKGALEGKSQDEIAEYRIEVESLNAAVSAAGLNLRNLQKRVEALQIVADNTRINPVEINNKIASVKQDLNKLDEQLNGNRSKLQIGEKNNPTVRSRLDVASSGLQGTYGPTAMHRQNLDIAKSEFSAIRLKLEDIGKVRLPEIRKMLKDAGAPWIEGQDLPKVENYKW
ncbi:MAG: hypothetical protein K9G76_09770 [Bacteroidales bacterium]|nr:hypothetical protein [Bacteroidales bacterium]MCF8403986.1 hypothetical protein [Bacteroidales bacterium]